MVSSSQSKSNKRSKIKKGKTPAITRPPFIERWFSNDKSRKEFKKITHKFIVLDLFRREKIHFSIIDLGLKTFVDMQGTFYLNLVLQINLYGKNVYF